MLTGMRGHFAGGGESVDIRQEDGFWKLDGKSMQDGVGGSAQCVPSDQPQISGNLDFGGITRL